MVWLMAKNSEVSARADQPTVVSLALSSVMNQLRFTEVIEKVQTQTVAISYLPAFLDLFSDDSHRVVTGLQEAATTANEEKNKSRTRQEIPTADLVTSGAFKVGAKMIIKVEPSRKSSVRSEYVPNLTFDKFSLQAIAEADEERYQLHETFASEVLFVFGRRPRIWTFQGIVLNGRDVDGMNFTTQLLQDYEDYYRGTKSIELRAKTFILYEDVIVQGTLLSMTAARNSQVPGAVNVTLTMVVAERAFIGGVDRKNPDGTTSTPRSVSDLVANSKRLNQEKVKVEDILAPSPGARQVANEAEKTKADEQLPAQKKAASLEKQAVDAIDASLEAGFDKAAGEEEKAAASRAQAAALAAGDQAAADAAAAAVKAADDKIAAAEAKSQDADAAAASVAEEVAAVAKTQTQADAKVATQEATVVGKTKFASPAESEQTARIQVFVEGYLDTTASGYIASIFVWISTSLSPNSGQLRTSRARGIGYGTGTDIVVDEGLDTGVSGFDGKLTIRKLLKEGYNVAISDADMSRASRVNFAVVTEGYPL
jgi:hypothetical protein